jgi:imidazolonepropionase-like amidohydrolase
LVAWQPGVSQNSASAEQWRRALEAAQRFVGLLLERGVPVLTGSDTPCGPVAPGLSLWRELALLVEAGMSPEQAFQAATSAPAAFLGRPELGRISVGSAADLVFVRGNPLAKIPARPEISLVVRGGEILHPQDLINIAAIASQSFQENPDPWAVQFKLHSERNQKG